MKKVVYGILVAACLIVLSGCGGLSIPTEDGGKLNFTKDGFTFEGTDGTKGTFSADDEGGVVISTDEGEVKFGEDLKLPKDYPENILPLYKEDSIVTTSTADGGFYVVYRSKASVDDCTEYYKGLVEDIEGKVVTTSDTGTMIFANIEGKECAIMITEDSSDEDKASVSLTIAVNSD